MTLKEHINFHGLMPLLSTTCQHSSILSTHEIYVTPPTITLIIQLLQCGGATIFPSEPFNSIVANLMLLLPLLKKLNNYHDHKITFVISLCVYFS
jgi:hypothetical protein